MYTNDTDRLFAEGGMNDQGGTVDPVSGNDVPAGSLQNEVRDDIDVKISEGEFVIPADVVRYIGLERLMKLRDEAKQGLSRMAEIGQMGNSQEVENPDALHEDEEGFDSEIDDIMQEVDGEQMGEKKFVDGGFAVPGTDLLNKYNIPKTSITNPALDVRAYKNKEGRVMYITFFNDKPSIAIPAGYEFAGSAGQFIAETKKTDEAKPVVTATETIESGGDGPTGLDGGATVGGSGIGTGTGIGNSAIGIAIGAVANAVANAMGLSNTPNDAISVSDATPSPASVDGIDAATDASLGEAGTANAAAAAANAAAAATDASLGEAGTANAAANAANDAAADADAGDDGSSDGTAGGSVGGDGTGPGSFAKGGLVAKRTKKPTPAKKRGIASKK
jgi:hypothetical protein